MSVGTAERVSPFDNGLEVARILGRRRARRAVAATWGPARVEHGPLAQLLDRRAAWSPMFVDTALHARLALDAGDELRAVWRRALWGMRLGRAGER